MPFFFYYCVCHSYSYLHNTEDEKETCSLYYKPHTSSRGYIGERNIKICQYGSIKPHFEKKNANCIVFFYVPLIF